MKAPDYIHVEHMIFRGFLVSAMEIEGIPIVFKTINQTEYDLSLLYAVSADPEVQAEMQEAFFILNSVFLFNRSCILAHRDEFSDKAMNVILNWPSSVRLKLLQELQKLNALALRAILQVEGFTYGQDSRQRWALMKNIAPNDPRVTGIPGTEFLGLNMHQRLWFHYNTVDDKKEDFDLDWSRTKFAASVHSKEISKIDSQDKTRARDALRRRESIFMGYASEDGVKGAQGEVKVANENVDDLLGQLKRDIEGQKDFHDLVVESHERKVRENHERKIAQKELQAQRSQAYQKERLGAATNEPVVFYDEAAVSAMVSEGKAKKRQALLSGQFLEESAFAEQTERMQKWGIVDRELTPETSSREKHPLEDTVLGNYYDVSLPDMDKSNPFSED